jgi:hypothetical protein
MRRNLIGKTLALGVVVLFISVGIHPAFAVEDKASTSENEKPTNADDEIYENTNCFIMVDAENMGKSGFSTLFCGTEYQFMDTRRYTPAKGKIITLDELGEWNYEGKFYGLIRYIVNELPWGEEYEYYFVGVEGFRGFVFPGPIIFLFFGWSFAIGFAEHVKIGPDCPWR